MKEPSENLMWLLEKIFQGKVANARALTVSMEPLVELAEAYRGAWNAHVQAKEQAANPSEAVPPSPEPPMQQEPPVISPVEEPARDWLLRERIMIQVLPTCIEVCAQARMDGYADKELAFDAAHISRRVADATIAEMRRVEMR